MLMAEISILRSLSDIVEPRNFRLQIQSHRLQLLDKTKPVSSFLAIKKECRSFIKNNS